MRPDDVLDWRAVELFAPGTEKRGLPEPSGASVAVRERMDEFELVVENAALDQHRVFAVSKPREEVLHERGDVGERRGHMDDAPGTVHHANIAVAELSWAVDKAPRHQAVRFQEVVDGIRIERLYRLVGGMGTLDLVDFALRPGYALAGENGRDLLLGESVALDGRGAANRADVVDLAKPDAVGAFEDDPIPFDGSGDFGNQVHRPAAYLVRGNVFSCAHFASHFPWIIFNVNIIPKNQPRSE